MGESDFYFLVYLGTSMSKRLSRHSRDFFTGIPNIYSASPDPGAPVDADCFDLFISRASKARFMPISYLASAG